MLTIRSIQMCSCSPKAIVVESQTHCLTKNRTSLIFPVNFRNIIFKHKQSNRVIEQFVIVRHGLVSTK